MNNVGNLGRLVALAFLATTPAWGAAPTECTDQAAAATYTAQFEQNLEALQSRIKTSEAGQQHRNEYIAGTLTSSGAWSESERSNFFTNILTDPKFVELQEKKQKPIGIHIETKSRVLAMRAEMPVEACGLANESLDQLLEVLKLNNAQYDYMRSKMTDIAKAKGVRIPLTTDDLACMRTLVRMEKEGVIVMPVDLVDLACPPSVDARPLTADESEAYRLINREYMDAFLEQLTKQRKAATTVQQRVPVDAPPPADPDHH